jgi:hypothetical protein
MKPLFKHIHLSLLVVVLAGLLSGCLFPGSLSVSTFEGIVSISAGGIDIGTCFADEEDPGTFDCINNEIFSTFETLTLPELLFRLVLLDPLVVQFPAEANNFSGSFLHNDTGANGNLAITAGLNSVAIDVDRTLTAEPGMQLVVIGFPDGAPTTGNFSFNLNFQAPPGASSVEVKPIITGLVELTDGSIFYPPILPCVDSMADAPAVTISLSGSGGVLNLPPLTADMGCNNVTYNFIPDGTPPPDDSDGDGVLDGDDACPATTIPESVPTNRLGVNRFALIDNDTIFDTTAPQGTGPKKSFTTTETGGCSCEQIIAALGLGAGHEKFGCSIGVMEKWSSLINP